MINDTDLVFERFSYGVGDFNEMVGPVRIERSEAEAVALTHGLLLVDLQELVDLAMDEGLQVESVSNGEDSDDVCVACRKPLSSDPHTRQDCVSWALARERNVAELELAALKETARLRGETIIKLSEKLCACETELENALAKGG